MEEKIVFETKIGLPCEEWNAETCLSIIIRVAKAFFPFFFFLLFFFFVSPLSEWRRVAVINDV